MAERSGTPAAAGPARESALGDALVAGDFGNLALGVGATLTERPDLSIWEVAVWDGGEAQAADAIGRAIGLGLSDGRAGYGERGQAFRTAPDRWLVASPDAKAASAMAAALKTSASAIDLSHGLTVIRIGGERSLRVLAQLVALDFDAPRHAPPAGMAAPFGPIRLRLQRLGASEFDIFVPRSRARAFWAALTRAGTEAGYRVTESVRRDR